MDDEQELDIVSKWLPDLNDEILIKELESRDYKVICLETPEDPRHF